MKVAVKTLGCRMNQFDTSLITEQFVKNGYTRVSFEELADIYIVNTCTVTSGGDRASRQAIYQAKRKNPNAVVVATGCYAQVKPKDLVELDEVDLVVGNTHRGEILKIVEEFLEKREKRSVVGEIFREKEVKDFDTVLYFENSRPFLKIQEGCNKFCSFCVIPFARGKVRSVPEDKVLEQVRSLAEAGFKEVVLSGTQLSQYGWDLGSSLYKLLNRLLSVKGIELFRLSSMHIKEIGRELLGLMVSEERIAPHFHLSLQSGSDKILSLMERGYTKEEFLRVVEFILSKRGITAIGTDVIVGFPSESDRDFEESYKFLEETPFAYLHVFPYSDRPLTKASKMGDKVKESVKRERVRLLRELDAEKREKFLKANRGKRLRAVALSSERLLTENYIDLHRRGNWKSGDLVEVII